MKQMIFTRLALTVAILAILVSITAISQTGPEAAAQSVTRFPGNISVRGLATIDNGLTIGTDLTVGDDATITGDLTVSGSMATGATTADTVASTAGVDVGTFLNLSAQTAISVTAAATITPTGTYQPLTSFAPVTTSTTIAIANGGQTGDLLILRNANAADVIIVDGAGGNVECNGDIALGANDILTLIWNGADWTCVSLRDNSA